MHMEVTILGLPTGSLSFKCSKCQLPYASLQEFILDSCPPATFASWFNLRVYIIFIQGRYLETEIIKNNLYKINFVRNYKSSKIKILSKLCCILPRWINLSCANQSAFDQREFSFSKYLKGVWKWFEDWTTTLVENLWKFYNKKYFLLNKIGNKVEIPHCTEYSAIGQ